MLPTPSHIRHTITARDLSALSHYSPPAIDTHGQLAAGRGYSHSLQGAAHYDTLQHPHTTQHSLDLHIIAYTGQSLPSESYRLTPRVPSLTSIKIKLEAHGHMAHQKTPELPGERGPEGAPPPHTATRGQRCIHKTAPHPSSSGDTQQHIDTDTKHKTTLACETIHTHAHPFKQKNIDPHSHIHGMIHRTLHIIGMPQTLHPGTEVGQTEGCDTIIGTASHVPTPAPSLPPNIIPCPEHRHPRPTKHRKIERTTQSPRPRCMKHTHTKTASPRTALSPLFRHHTSW